MGGKTGGGRRPSPTPAAMGQIDAFTGEVQRELVPQPVKLSKVERAVLEMALAAGDEGLSLTGLVTYPPTGFMGSPMRATVSSLERQGLLRHRDLIGTLVATEKAWTWKRAENAAETRPQPASVTLNGRTCSQEADHDTLPLLEYVKQAAPREQEGGAP